MLSSRLRAKGFADSRSRSRSWSKLRDILPTLERWLEEGHRFALATVTHTWGSSPRPVGAMMAIRDDGAVAGSVSGGCVESAVMQEGLQALATGIPKQLDFGALS